MLIGLMGRLLAAHKGTVLAIVLLQLVQTTATLLLPTLNAAIIDDGIVGGDMPEILRLGSWMAAIALVQVVAAIAAGYLGAVAAMELGRPLREELFAKVQSMSSQEVGSFGAASLVTRATNDVAQIQNLVVLVFTMLVAAPAIFVGGILLAIHQDVVLSGIVVAVIPVLAVIMVQIVRRLVPLYRQGQDLIDRTSRMLREQIIGANVIRGFVRQGHEIRRFDAVNQDLTQNNLRSALLVAGMMPLIMLVVNLSSVGVVWFGGHRIQSGEMRLGALTAFIAYILQILIAIMMAMYVFMTAPRAAACAERIQAVLDTSPAITDGPGRRHTRGPRRGIPERLLCVSRGRDSGPRRCQLHGRSRNRDGCHRRHRQRQDHPAEPAAQVPGRHRRTHQHRRMRCQQPAAGHAAEPDRRRTPAFLSVLRDACREPADGRPGRDG